MSVASKLPGYASVARASEVLHLAPRSVRDLIYTGRLPSQRIGRLHYIHATDLEVERRRRLGLPMPHRVAARKTERTPRRLGGPRPRVEPTARRQRATERAALVRQWAQRHEPPEPQVPFVALGVSTPFACQACGRQVAHGRMVESLPLEGRPEAQLCLSCGRRALLDWADRRRHEAGAARRLSQSLGEPQAPPAQTQVA